MQRIIIMTAALLFASTAMAQELTAAQRDACMGDYEKYCKGTVPGGGRIIACLAKQNDKLTPACKKVLADAEKNRRIRSQELCSRSQSSQAECTG